LGPYQFCTVNRNALLATEIQHSAILKPTNMYALKNKVQLIGNLGSAPEVRILDGGRKVARFSVATHESYRDANGVKIEETQWHQVVAWGKVAEIAEKQLQKGTEVALEGKLVHRNYTDKEGVKKYVTEVVVAELLLLGHKVNKQEE
jgi:single-strand DNA-binding protein